MTGRCEAVFRTAETEVRCERPDGHRGQHEARRRALRWGGRTVLRRPPVIRPAPGKPPASAAPALTPAGKFAAIPGEVPLFTEDEITDGPR